MKRILFVLFLLIASLAVDAQVNFMGIPVDGDATSMIKKLKEKGFVDTSLKYEVENVQVPILEGRFNGKDVYIYLDSNKGKVWRVVVYEYLLNPLNASQAIIQFNDLFRQFENNPKYSYFYGNEIEQKENISYEMSCHNKQYEADFQQILYDNKVGMNDVWFMIVEKGFDKYCICIFYDNLLNAPNGEDL